ncbi:rhodopsin, partial [Pseudolycoriella hygida]
FTGLVACSDAVISGTGSNVWCLANKTIWLTTFQVSSVTMFAVALDRFTAIFFPFYHVQKVKHHPIRRVSWAITAIWLAATALVVFTAPSLAYQRYFSPNGRLIHCELAKAFDIFQLKDEKSQNVLLIVANLAHFWLPFLIISVIYGAIVVKVWKRKLDETTTLGQKDTILLQKWRTIRMIIAAVVVFILCWLPFFIVNIYYFVKGSQHKRPCTESVPFLVVMWLAFSRKLILTERDKL